MIKFLVNPLVILSQSTSQLQSMTLEKPDCLDIICLGSEVPALILQVFNSSLQVALTTIGEEVSSLESLTDSLVSKVKPSVPPKVETPNPSTNTPSQPVQTPAASESHGVPHFVSSIPAKAPGAPKFPATTSSRVERRAEASTGKPHAVSTIPKSAKFEPVPESNGPSHVKKNCHPPDCSNPLLPSLSGLLLKRLSHSPPQPLPLYSNPRFNNFATRINRRSIAINQHNELGKRHSPSLFSTNGAVETQVQTTSEQQQTDNYLLTVPSSSSSDSDQVDNTNSHTDEDVITPDHITQLPLNSSQNSLVYHHQYQDLRKTLDTMLSDFVKDIQARFERDHDALWKNINQEYSTQLPS